ncbi:MAG TPA: hypothetical protein VGS07_04040 [Thermoanaerobaculia bacterium]|jgi:hypothetical protein|nr:hypothetical protein [Thermoanaerobaculia bacterium]
MREETNEPIIGARKHATDYARSAIDGFVRLLLGALLACASLWLLLATGGQKIAKLKDHRQVLAWVLQLDRIRYPYSQEIARGLFGDAVRSSNAKPFKPFTSKAYDGRLDADGFTFRSIYRDVSPACLTKYFEPINGFTASLKDPPKLLSPTDDLPFNMLGDNTDVGALEAVTEDHEVSLLDKPWLNGAIIDALNSVVANSQAGGVIPEDVLPFDHDGVRHSIADAVLHHTK